MPAPSVLVLGGGLAGLAAAIPLAEEGFDVRLVEKRGFLGGRAGSFQDPSTGEFVDNGQHVALRCCTNLEDLLRRIGASDRVHYHDAIEIRDELGRAYRIRASLLPAPLHLLPSLLRFRPIPWREKRALVRAVWRLLRDGSEGVPEGQDFLSWLRQQRQGGRAIRYFWEPLLVAALNEELGRMSARAAGRVVFEAMLRNRNGYEVAVPAEALAKIFSERGLEALAAKGVRVELRRTAVEIVCEGTSGGAAFRSLRFSSGDSASADYLIATLPVHQLLPILPPSVVGPGGRLGGLRGFRDSPIVGIHLWFDRPVIDSPFVALAGRTIQWAFDKSSGGLGSRPGEFGVSLVVSAARRLESWTKEQIVETALRELAEAFPSVRKARLLRSIVMREPHATFSPEPGSEGLRPKADCSMEGLVFAGDWVSTGWPATMEGAVRSGYLAAERILEETGRPKKLVRSPLPPGRLDALLSRVRIGRSV